MKKKKNNKKWYFQCVVLTALSTHKQIAIQRTESASYWNNGHKQNPKILYSNNDCLYIDDHDHFPFFTHFHNGKERKEKERKRTTNENLHTDSKLWTEDKRSNKISYIDDEHWTSLTLECCAYVCYCVYVYMYMYIYYIHHRLIQFQKYIYLFFNSSIRNENFRFGEIIKRFSQSDFTRRLKQSSFVRFAWLLIFFIFIFYAFINWLFECLDFQIFIDNLSLTLFYHHL